MFCSYSCDGNRPGLRLQPRQLALDGESAYLFHPSGSAVQGLDLISGKQEFILRGHFESINACRYNVGLQELYTAGNDNQIFAWAAPSNNGSDDDEDNWSD